MEIFRIRKEGSFTDDVFCLVEKTIDRLEPEVGHSHRIVIRVDETYGDLSAPGFMNRPSFLFEDASCLLNQFPGNHSSKVERGKWIVVKSTITKKGVLHQPTILNRDPLVSQHTEILPRATFCRPLSGSTTYTIPPATFEISLPVSSGTWGCRNDPRPPGRNRSIRPVSPRRSARSP